MLEDDKKNCQGIKAQRKDWRKFQKWDELCDVLAHFEGKKEDPDRRIVQQPILDNLKGVH